MADAVRNNAAWCDSVCSAHGGRGELSRFHWLCRTPMPSFYPNLVTLDPSLEPAIAAVRELERVRPATSWSVKDSFGVLPLEEVGFRLLFEAEWIFRPARAERSRSRARVGRWSRVRSEAALAEWEAAWGESRGLPRIFVPALLPRSEIAILAAHDGKGAIEAGVVANRSGNAVGPSSFFARAEEGGSLRAEGIEVAIDAFPGLPLVGYEAGEDLAAVRMLGFRSLGSLRVWVREG